METPFHLCHFTQGVSVGEDGVRQLENRERETGDVEWHRWSVYDM